MKLWITTKCRCCEQDERISFEYYCIRCNVGECEWHKPESQDDDDEDEDYYEDED